MKIKGKFNIKVGTKQQREIAEKVIRWCFENKVVIRHGIDIDLKICKYVTHQCWGTCIEHGTDNWPLVTWFNITVANDQTIRDFVATLIHELIHVNQYITGEWEGDGEKECEEKQFVIADEIWENGVL